MKTYLLAATAMAAVAVAAPASARDHTAYFGLEIGPMWVQDLHVRFPEFTGDGSANFDVDHKLGVDGDLIAGYDFGMIRAEVEGAHKWAKHDKYTDDFDSIEGDGHSRAYSLMGNLLLDVGKDDTFNFYAGGGVGIAWVREKFDVDGDSFSIKDSGLAWQAIAGVRAPVFAHFDIGLKYRYFHASKIKDVFDGDRVTSRFRSHSLLASLIYNFGPPEAPPPPPVVVEPPPPPPPPPATQTCPDGSVILATDACPLPPPPPPPPPPEPERG